ncbi:hypothetical protein BU26DRAFT_558402 [Trematosphaeria pertusa]|uniref:Uncharacterized protein n=1 Tax=Trematosphaeria pertusa TaxID=390896 RepID=A0A6A6J2C2_9PLEO|nr:uncharacterized protein BU26DRAFT_558402 [Trematosphaeria pertusa]KAF2256974.1 hypothetical protein BU26DRAFT_558402 [Trematosphaeria pertusa]
MAGRILPIALATISGVAIGVATFDGEFKAQQRERLEEDYKRNVTAVSALNTGGPSPMASSATQTSKTTQSPVEQKAAQPSRLSSMLGSWAWRKETTKPALQEEAVADSAPAESKQKP